ncbi:right-handed parallel beta-helix repeat-containing protein [Bacteroidota bacterium]
MKVKKLVPFLVILCILPLLHGQDAIFYVTPEGSDNNPGTRELPFKSVEEARDACRNSGTDAGKIILLPGDYFLSETIELDVNDKGLVMEAEQEGSVTLYGGEKITDWKQGEDGLWYAELSEIREGTWDFRALIVNGAMAERARYPESGTFIHRQVWDVKVLPAVSGYWERQPRPEEKLVMAYNPDDIPETLDIRNAELRVYHMWDESMVGIATNDRDKHEFTFSQPATYPPGAFGVKKYVIFNTREGMTCPGQWYLDRTAGRVVYWPRTEENMKKANVIAPRLETVIQITGKRNEEAKNITLRNFSIQATNIPLKSAGWGGGFLEGAVRLRYTENCSHENLEIHNTAGIGIQANETKHCKITGCDVHHTGACGLKFGGAEALISENQIHDVGVFFPSSAAIYVTAENTHIYRNQLYNAPYSGMILFGSNNLIEENTVSRVMQELHDGAAIYSSGTSVKNTILRGNLVQDIVEVGQGYGVSAYYFDEGAENCLVENNVSVGVSRPTHNHIVSGITYRDNTFICDGNMTLSFQRSADCIFEGNTLIAPGKINIVQPNGIKTWKNNVVFRDRDTEGESTVFMIDSVMPPYTVPGRLRTPAVAVKVSNVPVLDAELGMEEWPGEFHILNREPSRLPASGAPVQVKLAHDNDFLYIGAIATMFDPGKIRKGNTWQEDDGLELIIAGKNKKGEAVEFLIRLFASEELQCSGNEHVSDKLAAQLEKEILFASLIKTKRRMGGWYSEMAIPLKLLGIKAEPGLQVPFNLSAWCNEYGNWHCWEGNMGMGHDLEYAGMLMFK